MAFGPENPFYAESTLPYHAPPFDKIKDTDYQPALEAGMAAQIQEVEAIANDPAAPTFANTLVALEKSGQLYTRVAEVFDGVAQANTNPTLDKVNEIESPKRAAHQDAIFLNEKLFARVAAIHKKMNTLGLDVESRRLVDVYYKMFVHLGANLSAQDKDKLKKLNEEESTLENSYRTKLLAATKDAAYTTTDKSALQGLTDAEVAAAAEAAKERKVEGYVLPMQNTTQQPVLVSLANRATRQAIFEASWNRAERGGANDTRETIARLAQLRAEKAKLLGYPNYAAWNLEDQMAKTPEAAVKFMDALAPASTANAMAEGKDIQAVIDSQAAGATQKGGFQLQPWDWEFYSEQVRKAKYDIDDAQTKPYFEINNVLQNGVFYAANRMYGLTFKERKDIPVYAADVRVFEVFEASGKPLALMYFDYYKRDNKGGGAWMSNFVDQSKLLGRLPVIYNVANLEQAGGGRACADQLYRCDDDVPRVRPRAAWDVLQRGVSDAVGNECAARLCGVSLAVQRALGELPGHLRPLCQTLQDRRSNADGDGGQAAQGGQIQSGIHADRVTGGSGAGYAMAYHRADGAIAESGHVRAGGAGAEEDGAGYGASALPVELLHAHLERRLPGGILRLPVERDAGRRCVPVVCDTWRADAGQWRALPKDGAVAGIYPGAGANVCGMAGGRAECRADAEGARTGGEESREVGWTFRRKLKLGYILRCGALSRGWHHCCWPKV